MSWSQRHFLWHVTVQGRCPISVQRWSHVREWRGTSALRAKGQGWYTYLSANWTTGGDESKPRVECRVLMIWNSALLRLACIIAQWNCDAVVNAIYILYFFHVSLYFNFKWQFMKYVQNTDTACGSAFSFAIYNLFNIYSTTEVQHIWNTALPINPIKASWTLLTHV